MALKELFLPGDGKPAALAQRLVARALDVVIVVFILFVLVVTQIFWFMDDLSDANQYDPWGRSFVASVTFLCMYVIYEVVFHTFNRGQTPGKMALNIHVQNIHSSNSDMDPDMGGGSSPHLWQSLVRTAGPVAPLLFFEPWPWQITLVCLGMGTTALFFGTKRALHDLWAGTCVVYRVPTAEDEEFIRREKSLRKERAEKYSIGIFRRITKRDKNIEDE